MTDVATTFPRTLFMDLYEGELTAALPKKLRTEGVVQQRKNCIVGSIAFAILAVIAVAGAAYVIATTGGPSVNPIFFYTSVGIASAAVLLAIVSIGVMTARQRKAKSANQTAVQNFTAEPVTVPQALEKLAEATPEQFDATMKKFTDEQIGILVKHITEADFPQVLDALAKNLAAVKRIPDNAFSQELAVALLMRSNSAEMMQEDNRVLLEGLLDLVTADFNHALDRSEASLRDAESAAEKQSLKEAFYSKLERVYSQIFNRFPAELAKLTAQSPIDGKYVSRLLKGSAYDTYLAELTKLTPEALEENVRVIEDTVLRHTIGEAIGQAKSLQKDDTAAQDSLLTRLENLGQYTELVISEMHKGSKGYPHFVILMGRLLNEANEIPDVSNIQESRALLMARFFYYPKHQDGSTRNVNLVRGLAKLPLPTDQVWNNMRAIVEPHQNSVWQHQVDN